MEELLNFWQYRFLLQELVKKGIKLKYRRSYLGLLWSLIEPLMTTVVLVVVFGTLFGNTNPTYPLYIISGRLMYSFFQSGTKGASGSIRQNASMIKKVYMPKYLYPLSSVLFNFIIFLLSLFALVAVDIYCGVVPTWRVIWWIPAFVLLIMLTTGVGMLLATLNVFFRDIEYIWNVLLLLIMYCSAIFYYPEKLLKSGFSFILNYNPLYQIILMCRCGILGEELSAWTIWYTTICSIVVLILGFVVFKKSEDKFILHI